MIIIVPVASDIFRKKVKRYLNYIAKLKRRKIPLKCSNRCLEYSKTSLATRDMISKRQVEKKRNC